MFKWVVLLIVCVVGVYAHFVRKRSVKEFYGLRDKNRKQQLHKCEECHPGCPHRRMCKF